VGLLVVHFYPIGVKDDGISAKNDVPLHLVRRGPHAPRAVPFAVGHPSEEVDGVVGIPV
jgi:hypothetical protein